MLINKTCAALKLSTLFVEMSLYLNLGFQFLIKDLILFF